MSGGRVGSAETTLRHLAAFVDKEADRILSEIQHEYGITDEESLRDWDHALGDFSDVLLATVSRLEAAADWCGDRGNERSAARRAGKPWPPRIEETFDRGWGVRERS